MNASIIFGLLPAALMMDGAEITVGIAEPPWDFDFELSEHEIENFAFHIHTLPNLLSGHMPGDAGVFHRRNEYVILGGIRIHRYCPSHLSVNLNDDTGDAQRGKLFIPPR